MACNNTPQVATQAAKIIAAILHGAPFGERTDVFIGAEAEATVAQSAYLVNRTVERYKPRSKRFDSGHPPGTETDVLLASH